MSWRKILGFVCVALPVVGAVGAHGRGREPAEPLRSLAALSMSSDPQEARAAIAALRAAGPAGLDALFDAAGPRYAMSSGSAGEAVLTAYHTGRLLQIDRRLRADRAAAGISAAARPTASDLGAGKVPASLAMPLAMTKAVVETPLLKVLSSLDASLAALADDAEWGKLGARHGDEARLGTTSRELLARESRDGQSLEEALRNFEASMATDTVRNEYTLHSRIHQWFVTGVASRDVDRLNDRVYAEIFLTPGSDPWLGLLPPNRFAALSNGGVREGAESITSSR